MVDTSVRGSGVPWLAESAIAHDLLGASHTIIGFASLLGSRHGDERDVRATTAIISSARRLAAIVESLTLLDRNDAKLLGQEPVPVDPAVCGAVEAHRELFVARGIEVVVAVDGGVTRIDANVLDRLLALILGWAILRSTAAGPVRISTATDSGRTAVQVQVAGSAAPDSCLVVATQLARSCGAAVHYLPGDGTVRLVLAAPLVAGDLAPEPPASRHCRILHVDDDEANRVLIELTLQGVPGCSLVSVASIAGAREELRRRPAHVVLADQHLAGERGMDLLRALRQDVASAGVHLFLMTGDRDPALVVEAHRLDISILFKPLDVDDLIRRIVAMSRSGRDRHDDAGVGVRPHIETAKLMQR
jgi:CheY-like chemotaxis protein